MSFDTEKFKNIFAGIQSVIVSIAVVVGGIWTLITFSALEEEKLAQAKLQTLELEAKQRAVLDITIKPSQESIPNDPAKYISAVVEVHNRGNRDTSLEFGDKSPFSAIPVEFDSGGNMSFRKGIEGRLVSAEHPVLKAVASTIVRAGDVDRIPFFLRVPGPGLYLLIFQSPAARVVQESLREDAIPVEGSLRWSSKIYFVVK